MGHGLFTRGYIHQNISKQQRQRLPQLGLGTNLVLLLRGTIVASPILDTQHQLSTGKSSMNINDITS